MLFPVNQGTGVVVAAGSATGPVVSSPEETGETVGLEEMGGCKEQASVSSNTIGGKNRAVSFKNTPKIYQRDDRLGWRISSFHPRDLTLTKVVSSLPEFILLVCSALFENRDDCQKEQAKVQPQAASLDIGDIQAQAVIKFQ